MNQPILLPPLSAAAHRARLLAAWSRSDQLFGLVPADQLTRRPISLRHPILFYIGHLPAFAWNQIARGALGLAPLDPELDQLFERGIDPADEAAAEALSVPSWPSLERVLAYRDLARQRLLELVDDVVARHDPQHPLLRGGRILHVAVEHELMHHETLLYMLQRQPELLRPPPGATVNSCRGHIRQSISRIDIPAGPATIGTAPSDVRFAWDNEVPCTVEDVEGFTIDRLPVTNLDLREFVKADGYGVPELWEGAAPDHPTNWVPGKRGTWKVRWLLGVAPMGEAALWPAQVSLAEARAYAKWTGGRLPTEAELHRAAYATPDGTLRQYPWGDDPPDADRCTADFVSWCPRAVGETPAGASAWGVEELVGNGWEWTDTVWQARPGFVADIPTYPGYSTDFFDDDHFVVFGGSWATAATLLRRSFRNWYQPRYPFVFSSFRTVRPTVEAPTAADPSGEPSPASDR